MSKLISIFTIVFFILSAVSGQFSTCQGRNRIQCQFSTVCQWSVDQTCIQIVTIDYKIVLPCHSFETQAECLVNIPCQWNQNENNCYTTACNQIDQPFMCSHYRGCQWIDNDGCKNQQP